MARLIPFIVAILVFLLENYGSGSRGSSAARMRKVRAAKRVKSIQRKAK